MRRGFGDRIEFDVQDLPHGVWVQNIGLNGILIPAGKSRQTIYLAAAPWVGDTDRLFFAVSKAEGEQASLPVLLRVRRPAKMANSKQ